MSASLGEDYKPLPKKCDICGEFERFGDSCLKCGAEYIDGILDGISETNYRLLHEQT